MLKDNEDIEVLQDTSYYIPTIIRILDEVDNSDLSDEDKTIILDSLIDSNTELSSEEKTIIRDTVLEQAPVESSKKKKNTILIENIKMLIRKTVFIILLFYILFFHIFGFTRIRTQAMAPNIAAGDLLLFYRWDKDYMVGDVITFVKDKKQYTLRIIALEGQTVGLNIDGDFLIDGDLEEHQTFLKNKIPDNSSISYPYRVPKGKVFVVGDYRSESNDSRMFGAIDVKDIKGKVISLLQTKDI